MSCDWRVGCLACRVTDESEGFLNVSGRNAVRAIISSRYGLIRIFEASGRLTDLCVGNTKVDLDFLYDHLNHRLAPADEYGNWLEES